MSDRFVRLLARLGLLERLLEGLDTAPPETRIRTLSFEQGRFRHYIYFAEGEARVTGDEIVYSTDGRRKLEEYVAFFSLVEEASRD